MPRFFIIDGTDDGLYYELFSKHINKTDIDLERTTDKAVINVGKKPYSFILISRATGKADHFDIAEAIKYSRLNKHAQIILIEDMPTTRDKFSGYLRGRHVYTFKSNELDKLEKLVVHMVEK